MKRLSIRLAALYTLCAIILSVCLPAASASADETAPTVRVGYYENEVFEEGAQPGSVKTGYAYEYYLKLSEYTGWRYEYVYGSFSDLYQQLLNGDVDVLAGLAWREDRAGSVGYPALPMGSETYNLVKHASDHTITANAASLGGKRIGVLDSALRGVLENYLASYHVQAEVVPFTDYELLFQAFDAGELDAFAGEGDGAYGRDDAQIVTGIGSSDYFLCTSVRRPDLLAELNEAQTQLTAEEPNYLSGLRAKYYPRSISSRAFTTAEQEWLRRHDTLRLAYLNNYLPYSATNEKGEPTGIIGELVPQMLEGLGLKDFDVVYRGYDNYEQMVQAVVAGEADAAFPVGGGLYYSEESGIYQSNPVVASSMELVFKGEYSEGKATHFAVNENNAMQLYYVKAYYPDAKITMYPGTDACLKAVDSGAATCTTLNGLRAYDIMKNSAYSNLSMHQLGHGDARGFGVKIGNEGLLKLLNRGVNVVGEEYAMNIAYRYTDELYEHTLMDAISDHAPVFVTAVLAVAGLVIFLLVRDSRRTKAQMRDKEKAREELEEKNRELERSKEALAEALLAAEDANRAKTQFLNSMSHDIRTPMNAIVGFTALASANIDDTELVSDYLDKISVSSKHLLSLINDVLDMSRIESGKVNIEVTDTHLPDLVADIETIVRPSIDEKRQEFVVDTRGLEHEDVVVDRLRLNQVLLNILSNAVKFTPEGGSIRLVVGELPSDDPDVANLEFRVRDNGIGMSEEFQEKVFDAFTREETSTVSGISGTGLGMAITKNIVELMGGDISVTSKVGEGSEFVVRLSCAVCDEAVGRGDRVSRDDATESAGGPAADLVGCRVLLVEDNQMNQLIAVRILENEGVLVDVADDGVEALQMIEEADADRYDVILMDVQMPRMDGHEATRRIRALADERKARLPIIAMTANAFEEDERLAREAGMNDYLPKPYEIDQVLTVISRNL